MLNKALRLSLVSGGAVGCCCCCSRGGSGTRLTRGRRTGRKADWWPATPELCGAEAVTVGGPITIYPIDMYLCMYVALNIAPICCKQ